MHKRGTCTWCTRLIYLHKQVHTTLLALLLTDPHTPVEFQVTAFAEVKPCPTCISDTSSCLLHNDKASAVVPDFLPS